MSDVPLYVPRRALGEHLHNLRYVPVGNLLWPYGTAYRRANGLSTSGLFTKSLCGQRKLIDVLKWTMVYRGTSLIRNTPLLGLYSRDIPRVLWWS